MSENIYLRAFCSSIAPAPKIPIDEWADTYRILPSESSAEPGKYRTDRMPYIKEISIELSPQSNTQRVSVMKGTQLGLTELANNMVFTYADLYPCPMLLILPTESLANTHAKDKLWPSIEKTPKIANKIYKRKKDGGSSLLDVRFPGGNLRVAYSFTTSTFASVSRRIVIKDDLDRWPDDVKGEGNPSALADKRADAFPNKKIYANSSPTLKQTSKIYKEFLDGSQALFNVKCPKCGSLFPLEKELFKYEYDDGYKLTGDVKCECPHCEYHITETKKHKLFKDGEWVHKYPKRDHKSYRLPSYYSPFLTWNELFQEYLSALKQTEENSTYEDMKVWVNTRDASPWEETFDDVDSSELDPIKMDIKPWTIPQRTAFLTMAVDVQLDHFWIDVFAWQYGGGSVSIRHGRVETWVEVEEVMRYQYRDESDHVMYVRACPVDSGYHRDEVYEFCAMNSDIAFPIKGTSTAVKNPYKISTLDNGLKLHSIDVEFYKDMFWAKIERTLRSIENGTKSDGLHRTHSETEQWYFDQLTSEHKVVEVDKRGREKVLWAKRKKKIDNHLFDTSVYNTFVGELLGIRFISEMKEEVKTRMRRPKRQRRVEDEYADMI